MKMFLLALLVFSLSAFAHEKELKTKADKLASGVFTEQKNHRWPFPLLSIGHNMQSYQDYSSSPYWHDGLDIRSREAEAIVASAGGKVVNIENYIRGNELYWEIAILDDEGFVWKYHHVDEETIPEEIKNAYRSGVKIAAGALLGNVVRWPISSFGETYHHLHLLVVARDGRYVNPFLMMEPLPDTQAPVISRIGISQKHKAIDGTVVKGEHGIFVEASDLVFHQKFILPPHKISYRLNGGEEKVVWTFTHLPSGRNDVDYIKDFYLSGTCGNYSCRKILININFTQERPRAQFNLPTGSHQIEVLVEDMVGNKASKSFDWRVE